MGTKRHLELVDVNAVACPRLNEDPLIAKTLEAIVHSFKDGTTAVLCDQFDARNCKKTTTPCVYLTEESRFKPIETFDDLLELANFRGSLEDPDILDRKVALLRKIWDEADGVTFLDALQMYIGQLSDGPQYTKDCARPRTFCFMLGKRIEPRGYTLEFSVSGLHLRKTN